MKKLIIKNAEVVLSDKVLHNTDVAVVDGKIAEIGKIVLPEGSDFDVFDATGKYLVAGFIEMHVHGGGGFDFMDGSVDAFINIVDNHCMHGTTSIVPTTIACSEEEMFTLFDTYRKAAGKVKTANLLGVHLEGPFISPAMKGAQPEAYVRTPSKREIDKIVSEAGDIVAICSMAPEIEGIEYAAKKLKDNGVALSIAHSNAIAADVFKAYDMGFDHVTHLYSNTPGIRKINQIVYAGIPEAVYLIDGMTVELIGDGKHVPKEAMQMVLKLKGAEKVSLVTDAMRAAGQNVTESYLGKICPEARVIVEDGVAKLPDRTFYAGSIATSEIAFRNAVMNYEIPITSASTMMSAAPAKFLGIGDRKGSIKVGYDADLVVTDLSCNVENVFVGGRQVK